MSDAICDISPEVKDELRKFRFRKDNANCALILKVDREKQLVCVDELLDEISVDELQEQLPGHQPRYIVYSYKMVHDDNRISYPMCFIFYTLRDSQMELQIMYAGSKRALQREADLTRVYEVRELDRRLASRKISTLSASLCERIPCPTETFCTKQNNIF